MEHRIKVILAAGGSGGHIFPSVALASELEKKGVKDISFVASKRRLDRSVLGKTGHRCFFLSVNPMPFGFSIAKGTAFLAKLLADAAASFFIVAKERPDIVVGFGGYSSGAVVRCARLFGIPVLIHEQNIVPGRANRMLASSAGRVAVSFAETDRHFLGSTDKVVYTGNPIRLEILDNDRVEALRFLGLSPDKRTVLIMGGSQGSSFLNTATSAAMKMVKDMTGDKVQVVHLTGDRDKEIIEKYYADNSIPAKVYSFLERIDKAYAACDLAVSRAGAAAIFELAYYARPMVLVPYPSEKNNQRYNAIYFSEKGAAVYREESELTPEEIADEISGILDDTSKLDRMSRMSGLLGNPRAGSVLADEVIKLAEG